MRLKRYDLEDMPTMLDKIDFFLMSDMLMAPYNSEYYKRIGLDKAEFTRNTRNFIGECEKVVGSGNKMRSVYDKIEDVRLSGRPRFSFKPSFFENCNAMRVLFQGYERFVIRIFGNPLRFMRKACERQGLINSAVDADYRIYDDNYLYPQLTYDSAMPLPEFEAMNRQYVPNFNDIGGYVTSEVLKDDYFGTFGGVFEYLGFYDRLNAYQNDADKRKSLKEVIPGGIYSREMLSRISVNYIEVNRDVLLPKPIAKAVMRTLRGFFASDKGSQYYSNQGVSRCKVFDNRDYEGIQIVLYLPKGHGRFKIYCKTRWTIRAEICLYGVDLIHSFKRKGLGVIMKYNKGKWHLTDSFRDLVDASFDMIDLHGIICRDIEVKEVGHDLLLAHSKLPDCEKVFWAKVLNNVYLDLDEIPRYLKPLVQRRHVYDSGKKRGRWRYELRPEYREKFGIPMR